MYSYTVFGYSYFLENSHSLMRFTSSPSIGNLPSFSLEKMVSPSTSTSKIPPELGTPVISASL